MASPQIIGNIVRRIDMHCSANGKSKDYRITITEDTTTGLCRVYTEYGPKGSLRNGKEQTTTEIQYAQALRQADQIRDDKINQTDSYRVTSDNSFPSGVQATKPVASQKAQPPRKLISASSLSPASRASLAAIF
jgi:hypothetical protein